MRDAVPGIFVSLPLVSSLLLADCRKLLFLRRLTQLRPCLPCESPFPSAERLWLPLALQLFSGLFAHAFPRRLLGICVSVFVLVSENFSVCRLSAGRTTDGTGRSVPGSDRRELSMRARTAWKVDDPRTASLMWTLLLSWSVRSVPAVRGACPSHIGDPIRMGISAPRSARWWSSFGRR